MFEVYKLYTLTSKGVRPTITITSVTVAFLTWIRDHEIRQRYSKHIDVTMLFKPSVLLTSDTSLTDLELERYSLSEVLSKI